MNKARMTDETVLKKCRAWIWRKRYANWLKFFTLGRYEINYRLHAENAWAMVYGRLGFDEAIDTDPVDEAWREAQIWRGQV